MFEDHSSASAGHVERAATNEGGRRTETSVLIGVGLQDVVDSCEKAIQLLPKFFVLGVIGLGSDELCQIVEII